MKQKFIIYQLIPRLFGNTNSNCVPDSSINKNGCGKFSDITTSILKEIKSLGITHIWYTGVLEHATKTDYSKLGIKSNNIDYVKGEAGSPYAIKDYYDVDPDLAIDVHNRLLEFENLIERTHKAGIKVIIDFVPNHVSREYSSDSKPSGIEDFNNQNYFLLDQNLILPINNQTYIEHPAKATGNDCYKSSPSKNDWYDTVKLNYTNDNTWLKMAQIIEYWANKGIDGFRCDMAEMVPVTFWEWLIPSIKSKHNSLVFIAELYSRDNYELYLEKGKFDFLYDKTGLYDTLRDVLMQNSPSSSITKAWQSIDSIQNRMLNFLENHDEVRVASDFFSGDPFKVIPALGVSLLLNSSPFLIYFGQELGEKGMDSEGYSGLDGKTSIYDYWSVKTVRDWLENKKVPEIRNKYKELLKIALNIEAFSRGGTFDLTYANSDSLYFDNNFNYAFLRHYKSAVYIIIANFSESVKDIAINIPIHAFESFGIINSSISKGKYIFGGSGYFPKLSYEEPFHLSINRYSLDIIEFNITN